MAIRCSEEEAFGRVVAAGRMLAGIDQATLGADAGVSGATISNVEQGRSSRVSTADAIVDALADYGVHIAYKKGVGVISAQASYR